MKIITQIIQNISKDKDLTTDKKEKMVQHFEELENQKINILIIGGTGVGKSSTINAVFKGNVAPVGIKANPETMEITNFKVDENITIWDSPGLGDGIKDEQHKEKIFNLLDQKDDEGNRLIDCVLVVISANSKDLGTTYELINNVLIKKLGHEEAQKKLIIGINKSDEAIHSRYWDKKNHRPSSEQIEFLDNKVEDIKTRIFESTNVQLEPVYYVAGYNDENFKDPSWNVNNLMIYILKSVPTKKVLGTMESFGENILKDVVDVGIELLSGIIDLGKGILKGIFSFFK